MRFVPLLSVEFAAGALRYRLDVPERDLAEPLQEEFRQPLDDGTLRALLESADALLRSPASPGFPREAAARGAVLYRTLVPPRLRARVQALHGALLVSTALYGLPWELLHDGEEFWGLRYALGKRLVMDRALPATGAPRLAARPRALVIGSDPRQDLPFVRDEVEAVCAALEPFADIDCVTGRLATFQAVSRYLGGGFDVIHYCGHVVGGAGGTPALLLADEQPLTASAIEANLTGRPLVFLNGCASARGGTAHATDTWEATAASVAYGFLFGGAVGVVGTLSDVSDRHAAALATEFYHRALGKEPVGEALRAARAALRADPESAASPTWLSVVLYGNPAQVLLRGTAADAARTALPAPAPAPAPPRPARRRAAWWAALVALAVALAAGSLLHRRAGAPEPLVIGVMQVRSRGPAVPEWMPEITRDSLNTILSKFPGLRVYSRQKIDFVRQKRGVSEIEAAEMLGMSKMLSATVSTDGARVTLDLELIDIGTGMLEASEQVQGAQARFMELQAELALRAVHALGVKPTAEELRAIVASRGSDTLDVYRMLTETLGEPPSGGAAPPAPTEQPPPTSWLSPSSAWAQSPDPEETAIRALLARYGAALETKSIDELAALQVEMSETQRAALARYFGNATDLHVRISDIEVIVEGDEALATFTREDAFLDAGSGQRRRLEVRISGMLAKEQGAWKIRGLRSPS